MTGVPARGQLQRDFTDRGGRGHPAHMNTFKWGVLGAAKIAREKVIPALQQSELCEVAAIASRDAARARRIADDLGIESAYGSYEELLADETIDVIYNPLPNHLHVPWSIRALEAGKHVLCEKPVAMNTGEVEDLIRARDRSGKQIAEAFMVRHHPQWARVLDLISSGAVGTVTSFHGHFSYMNTDESDIRNNTGAGGGALMDIGCYMILFARMVFQSEPEAVYGAMSSDTSYGIDRLTSALLSFPEGHATLTCATQQAPYQSVQIHGTAGRIEVHIPVNTPTDSGTRIVIDDCRAFDRSGQRAEEVPAANQFTLQGDAFVRAISAGLSPVTSLEYARANMAVIDAVVESAHSGTRVIPKR